MIEQIKKEGPKEMEIEEEKLDDEVVEEAHAADPAPA